MKNKKGKKRAMGIGETILIVALVLLAGIGILAMAGINPLSIGGGTTQGTTTPSGDVVQCADSTGVLTLTGVSALDGAADPSSPTITCGVNGDKVKTSVTSGTTSFPVGAELECLVSKADYIDVKYTGVMACGGLVDQAELFYATSDNPSVRIKNDDGDFMTDNIAGGATNQTDLSSGETVVFDVEFQGTNTEATGDLIYVIEFPSGSAANISEVTMAGASKVSVPDVHTTLNAGSEVVAFEVSNIEGANKKTYALSVSLGSGKDLAGGVYSDWYAKQAFVDDDGFVRTGVEDDSGDAKYENTGDYDFYIN